MSDIFLSYAHEDLERVRPLVLALERYGWSTWWDTTTILPGQRFDQIIEKALETARCMIVVWSTASVQSDWVKDEAEKGRQRGILIPLIIDDDVQIPLAFRSIQAARLVHGQALETNPEFDRVITALTNLLGPPHPLSLYFDLDEFSITEITEIISLLSEIYQEAGGDRLIIDDVTLLEPSHEFTEV